MTYPISQPPLTHFIIYFIEFLKRTEIYRLVYYTHPYRFVNKAYEHDTRRDEKYSISPTSISETEVEEEMRKISPTVVDSFYPSDVESSLIPPFVPDPQHSDIPAFNATQALIGPIGQWTWHDYDNLPAKDVTHHLLYPRSFSQPRIVKGEYTATEEIHQYRIKRVLVDGIFLYTMSRPSLTPALVAALEQRSMKLPLLLTFQRPAADASRSEIVQAVALACNPKPAAATLFKNDEAVECHTAKTLLDYAVSLLSSVTRLNHAVLLLAGYVVDPDKLSSHQIVRNDHGRWLMDGLVPDKTRPLNDIEADELRQAVESLYESTQVPNVLGVTIGRCVAGVMDDDAEKRRFTLKILMQLCFPMTSYALYVMLFLHVIYAENCKLKSADALHLYRNLLLFQEIKNDLGTDPPKPYCHVVLATAVQYLPETASRIKGLEEAMNSKMGTYVHESLKDIFWRTYGWRYQ
ncbi:uncharacterized protein F4807DRAFT_430536 [Annulohypoxylon truncatum]|uniref:uncharacterized protein n=1 Tax=Annulohypoxylon truncatum TaxID=327061 RepID=UPI002008DD1A|nr:uncharacterized protein F4807DRAFT_430536 [Annulohypoxylon truncatum]KAI1208644.1 hypothetical protein F4807DRAFT_430536 [Annulohypoxylon truncatum]